MESSSQHARRELSAKHERADKEKHVNQKPQVPTEIEKEKSAGKFPEHATIKPTSSLGSNPPSTLPAPSQKHMKANKEKGMSVNRPHPSAEYQQAKSEGKSAVHAGSSYGTTSPSSILGPSQKHMKANKDQDMSVNRPQPSAKPQQAKSGGKFTVHDGTAKHPCSSSQTPSPFPLLYCEDGKNSVVSVHFEESSHTVSDFKDQDQENCSSHSTNSFSTPRRARISSDSKISSLRKRMRATSSSSDSSNEEDCYVPVEKFKETELLLKEREFELQRLRRTVDKLRKANGTSTVQDPAPNNHFIEVSSSPPHSVNKIDEVESQFQRGSTSSPVRMETDEIDSAVAQAEHGCDELNNMNKVFLKLKKNIMKEKLEELQKIQAGQKFDKSFVKLSALLMFGAEHLKKHSTGGRRNPKDVTASARPALDMMAMQGVQELLIMRVRKEKGIATLETSGPRCSLSTVRRYVGEKIQTLLISAARAHFASLHS